MPTYEYQCKQCHFTFEELQSFTEPVLTRCPSCGKETLARIIGGGSGLIFKGSGFYLTDYKKSSSSPASSATPPRKEEKSSPPAAKPSKPADDK